MWALLLLLVRGLPGIINQFHSLLGLTIFIHLTSIGHGHLLSHMIRLTRLPHIYNCVMLHLAQRGLQLHTLLQYNHAMWHKSQRDLQLYTLDLELAHFALRTPRQFSQLGMPLRQAFQKLIDVGLLTLLAPRPLSQLIPSQFRMDLHCAYHQGPGHETDRCTTLRYAIQDFINQGVVHLGQHMQSFLQPATYISWISLSLVITFTL